jgi:hypothetical protein
MRTTNFHSKHPARCSNDIYHMLGQLDRNKLPGLLMNIKADKFAIKKEKTHKFVGLWVNDFILFISEEFPTTLKSKQTSFSVWENYT